MITYVKGDATAPQGGGCKLLCHIVNNKSAWGAGFVLALSRKWRAPEYYYRRMRKPILGNVQFVEVEPDVIVCNMIAQVLGSKDGINIRYMALHKCLIAVNEYAVKHGCSVHAPRFGSGLSGGNWLTVEKMINKLINVPVFIYDL